MVHGVTCLLLLAMTIAHRGDCLPLEPVIEMGIISPEMLAQLHHRLQQEEDLEKIEREIGSVVRDFLFLKSSHVTGGLFE